MYQICPPATIIDSKSVNWILSKLWYHCTIEAILLYALVKAWQLQTELLPRFPTLIRNNRNGQQFPNWGAWSEWYGYFLHVPKHSETVEFPNHLTEKSVDSGRKFEWKSNLCARPVTTGWKRREELIWTLENIRFFLREKQSMLPKSKEIILITWHGLFFFFFFFLKKKNVNGFILSCSY